MSKIYQTADQLIGKTPLLEFMGNQGVKQRRRSVNFRVSFLI